MGITLKAEIGILTVGVVLCAALAAAIAQVAPTVPTPPAYTTNPDAAGLAPPAAPPPSVPIGALVQRTGGSLLRAESVDRPGVGALSTDAASFYNVPEPKPKLLRKHDLVTILIRETSQFATNANNALKHGNDLNMLIDSYLTFGSGPTLVEHDPEVPLQLETSGQRDFTGTAQLERDDTFTGRITAEVIDVKPNGTLVLQASEDIKTDEEEQKVTLTGTCRVEDVTPDNSVMSNQLYDLALSKQHRGAVKDATTRGFMTRLLDVINPF